MDDRECRGVFWGEARVAFERTGGCLRCAFGKVCLSVVDCAICKYWLGDCGVSESCEISVVSGFDRRQSLGWRLASLMERL